jgi:hypothetical protein
VGISNSQIIKVAKWVLSINHNPHKGSVASTGLLTFQSVVLHGGTFKILLVEPLEQNKQ